MKSKDKLVLTGRSLFKFEQDPVGDSTTIPTTFTITITTTGFSKERHIRREAVPARRL